MKKLQAEIDVAIPEDHVIPDITVLQKLPYLNAFIKESESTYDPHISDVLSQHYQGLRLYSSAPSLLERVVPSPAEQSSAKGTFQVRGLSLPPGTIVATQAW